MKRLNRGAAEAVEAADAHAVTDITGFGFLGHAHEMAHLGLVNFRFEWEKLPWLPGARRYAEMGAFPGGMGRNRDYFAPWLTFAPAITDLMQNMLWTPETSGGLLAAVAPAQVATFQQHCPSAVVVGEVLEGDGRIEVV